MQRPARVQDYFSIDAYAFENEIMDRKADGQTNAQIAEAMGITLNTVKSVVSNMDINRTDRLSGRAALAKSSEALLAALENVRRAA